jgi:fatty acid desaturase
MTMSVPSSTDREPHSAWDEARRRVQHKRDFRAGLVAYVVVNAFLVVIWLLTGRGYFWPGWVLAAWAVGILLDAYNTWVRQPVSETDVERELRRRSPPRT